MENFNFTNNVIETINRSEYMTDIMLECGSYDDFITCMFSEKVFETEQGVDWDDYRVNRSAVDYYYSIDNELSRLELTATDYGVGK